MPSSLIIVALAVAWLVVLVPMVARRRQEIARTGEEALTSRVVRSGGPRADEREESTMSESAELSSRREVVAHVDHEPQRVADHDQVPEPEADYADGLEHDAAPAETVRHRKGRGGFDPEAAELAARAKYAFRQRVVLALLVTMVISAVLAGVVLSALWWVTAAAATGLAGYLGYLRRQVRIEEDIRQRRLARLDSARSAARRRRIVDDEFEDERDYEMLDEEPMTLRGVERKPRPHSRLPRRNAIVVDIDDEDPAFHELDEPGPPVYRRAVGE